jgi:predicted nucleotidyltransferase
MTTSTQTSLAERLQISEHEWLLVADVLAKHLANRTVWAFGSRATGLRVKRFSDLDLAVQGRLTFAERAALSEAFDEALISFKVDVVETELIDADFLRRIQPDFVLLQSASPLDDTAS